MDSEGGIVFMKWNFRSLFLIVLAVCLALPFNGLAVSPRDISISVQWIDGWGNAQLSDPALPVTDSPEEYRFWLTVPYDAPLNALTLQISDLSGELTAFLPAQDETLPDVREAVDLQGPYTEITAFNAFGEQAKVFWLYISTQPMPQEETPVQGAAVTVHYVDEYWNPIAPDGVQTLPPGESTVYPSANVSAEDFELTSADSFSVFVDASGANPSEVWFVYHRLPKMAQITVRYLDENSQPLLADQIQTFTEGRYTVSAEQIDGYTLVSPGAFTVDVDALGNASPNEITFGYARVLAQHTVTVHYLDENGAPIQPDQTLTLAEGTHTVFADQIGGYLLTGADSALVSVDAYGANPAEIVFSYTRFVVTADVTVHYVDEFNRPLIADQVMSLEAGNHVINALEFDGYSLVSPSSFTVTVDESGARPSDITFAYALPPVSANVTAHYVDEAGQPIKADMIYTYDRGDHLVEAPAIEGYEITGQQAYTVTIDDTGAQPEEVTFVYARRIPDAQAVLRYINEEGQALLADGVQTLAAGTHTVYAETIPGYVVVGESAREVTVDMNGASPAEIVFVYAREVLPSLVTVHYIDERGETIAPDDIQQVPPGESQIYPMADISPDDYLLTGASSYGITVTADGASPSEITFTYQRVAKPVTVTLHYVDDLGNVIAADTYATVEPGIHAVSPEAIIPQDEYALLPPESVLVTVDVDGADITEITFAYQRLVRPVTVTVHYVDERGETIAPDTYQTYGEGEHAVTPTADIAAEDYTLELPASYALTVTLEGATLNEVTFTYRRVVKPAVITVHYVDTENNPVAADTQETFTEGNWVVFPNPADLPAHYELDAASPALQTVNVTADGASPSEVTFVYVFTAPEPVSVSVRCVDAETGEDILEPFTVSAPYGTDTEVAAPAAPQDYELASEPAVTVTVDQNGVSSVQEILFQYRRVPAVTEAPVQEETEAPAQEPTQEPQAEIQPIAIPVHYVDENGEAVASDDSAVCVAGYNWVYAAPVDLKENYTLIGEGAVEVLVDETGVNPPEVTFVYQAPQAQPEVEAAAVVIRYVDENGEDVASQGEAVCPAGVTTVYPSPADLKENYQLTGEDSAVVTVDENGASPAEVTFVYRYVQEAPAPKVALVNVRYLTPEKETFYSDTATCAEGMENAVSVDWSRVDSSLGYELTGSETVYVTVDHDGTATPAEVIFEFHNEISAYVTIRFLDAETGEEVASSQEKQCFLGANTVDAQPIDLKEAYALTGDASVTVSLNGEGVLSPAEVTFLYISTATATPAPQPPEFDTPMDAYFYPTGTSIRVRSTPTTAEDNIVTTVSNGDLGHVLGQITSSDNKIWYAVEINGVMGYMSETVVRFLTDAEMAALFNCTLPPTQPPTPAPTEIPDGAAIDRWGAASAQVNFRRNPDKSSDRLKTLEKNTRVWIYSSQTVNGDKWYSARYDGIDGYVMADYVNLTSQEESDAIQAQLASPMPTQQAGMEAMPTQAPTETPAPYKGYAVTLGQTALRTGVSMTDDTILETLADDSLVDVTGQTYVDGVAWASARVVASGNFGFIQQSALRVLTNEKALPYLERIQQEQIQVTPTQVPIATEVPAQMTGYAMTLGDGVPMRNYPDTNGEILMLLPYMAVTNVRDQHYTETAAWHLVQYGGLWGFIRQDQLRMMSDEEVQAYESSLAVGTPTPSPAPTPNPISKNSLSSYGHVKSASGKVNLRSEPTKKADNALRLLDNYAFALVLGSVENDEGVWYHVNQAGTEGYIHADYFQVLTLDELSPFLQSSEYLNANSNNASSASTSSQIQPVEDYNNNVWQNPALAASYEPFNPYLTPTPDPERLPTSTPVPAATATATPQIAAVVPGGDMTPEPTTRESGSVWPWLLLGLAVVGGGGAYYAYTVNKQNKRRQAARAQQARQARSAAAAHPQMRAADNNPARAQYPNQSAPFMPPHSAAPRPAQPTGAQNTAQGTQMFRPVTQETKQGAGNASRAQTGAPAAQGTQMFRPVTQQVSSETQTYRRPAGQDTQVYQASDARQGMQGVSTDTTAYRPGQAGNARRGLNLDIKVAQANLDDSIAPLQTSAAEKPAKARPASLDQQANAAPIQAQNTPADSEPAEGQHRRVRRTERFKDLYDHNDQA